MRWWALKQKGEFVLVLSSEKRIPKNYFYHHDFPLPEYKSDRVVEVMVTPVFPAQPMGPKTVVATDDLPRMA